MNPQLLTGAAAIATLVGGAFNSWLFWRLRAALLELRKDVLDEVEAKYVRKPEHEIVYRKRAAHA